MSEAITPDLITTSATVDWADDGGYDLFRLISVSVNFIGESETHEIGRLTGLIGWGLSTDEIVEASDAISTEAAELGWAAAKISEAHPEMWCDTVVILQLLELQPAYRGNRLTGAVVASLLDLFRLQLDSTVVVLKPEPQGAGGGPLPDGPVRDAAMRRLCSAYSGYGFRQWEESPIWWIPPKATNTRLR